MDLGKSTWIIRLYSEKGKRKEKVTSKKQRNIMYAERVTNLLEYISVKKKRLVKVWNFSTTKTKEEDILTQSECIIRIMEIDEKEK